MEISEDGNVTFSSKETLQGFLTMQNVIAKYEGKEKLLPMDPENLILYHNVISDKISDYELFIKFKGAEYGIWILSNSWRYNFVLFNSVDFISGMLIAGEYYNSDVRVYLGNIFDKRGESKKISELEKQSPLAEANVEIDSSEEETSEDEDGNIDLDDTILDY
jgi:hypothetical protein